MHFSEEARQREREREKEELHIPTINPPESWHRSAALNSRGHVTRANETTPGMLESRETPFDPRTVRPFKAGSRIEISATRGARLLFNGRLCVCLFGREERLAPEKQRAERENRASEDPGQFFPSLLDICRGRGEQARGCHRTGCPREREREREEDVHDQRRTVIYSGRGRSPWKM